MTPLRGKPTSKFNYINKMKSNYFHEYYLKNREVYIARARRYGKSTEYRFWKRWHNMKERCENPKHNNYKLWGGRGIKVSKRWQTFEYFKIDMWDSFVKHLETNKTIDTTLDRINTNKNYSKSNCKWSTMKEQQNNRRNNI